LGHEFFLLLKLKLQYFVQESAAKFTIFYLLVCKKKFFENLVFLTETVADLAVRYTLCGRYTLCAHCNADPDRDPDPAFFLVADPDPGSGSRI
jgi:hypothetical protein